MIMKAISKNKINDLLDYLAGEFMVFAPVSKDGQAVNFAQIEKGSQAKLDYFNSKESPKKLLFPQLETLFTVSKGAAPVVPDMKPDKKMIIFGMRPCDAKSFEILDHVFDGDKFKDPYYLEKRKNTLIFTLACLKPQRTCFCTSFGIGPFSKNGSDVMMIDTGDEYLIEAVTEQGAKVVSGLPGLEDAKADSEKKIKELAAKAEAKITRKVNLDNAARDLAELINDPVWNQIYTKCLGCGVCTFLCPTCHCFDIFEEHFKSGSKRSRIWDSCMYPSFTQEASGHNPRPSGKERIRQRIMHKFSYFKDNFDEFACVGCGRCMKNCPVAMDITNVIETVRKAKEKVAK